MTPRTKQETVRRGRPADKPKTRAWAILARFPGGLPALATAAGVPLSSVYAIANVTTATIPFDRIVALADAITRSTGRGSAESTFRDRSDGLALRICAAYRKDRAEI